MAEDFGMTSDVFVPDNLLAGSAGMIVTEEAILAAGQDLQRGALLGKITEGGKCALSLAAASDGSQAPWAVLAKDTDATGEDRTTVVYVAGVFNSGAMTFGTGHTAESVAEGLRDKGIFLKTTVPA
jgi:hypothetical protein